jgi:hypothetical protein
MAQQQPSRSRASRIRVRVQPRRPVDLQRLGRAVIELAIREVEAERSATVEAEQERESKGDEGTAA